MFFFWSTNILQIKHTVVGMFSGMFLSRYDKSVKYYKD